MGGGPIFRSGPSFVRVQYIILTTIILNAYNMSGILQYFFALIYVIAMVIVNY